MLRRRTATADHVAPGVPSRRDRGVTFIEILVSVVLLGTAGIAVLVATTAAITGARTSDQISKAQELASEVADYLTETDPENVTYVPCGTAVDVRQAYQDAIDAEPRFDTADVQVLAVRFEDPTGLFVDGVCSFGEPHGRRLQQVEFLTRVAESERTMTIVKRPLDVPTVNTVPAATAPEFVPGSGQAPVSPTDWMVNWP